MTLTRSPISLSRDNRFWYALYTRPRYEKKVDAELKQKGLESFLPMHTVIRFWSDRKKKIHEPLFPSYVFVRANSKERYHSLQCRGVVRMVSFCGQPSRIPDFQIEAVRRILESGFNPKPCSFFSTSETVEIISGPLMGLTGFITELRGKNRFVVSIDNIRQSIAIEIESIHLKRTNRKAPSVTINPSHS